MEERQVHVVEINAPAADVWAEITKLKQLQKPMFNTVLETDFKPGSRMIYRSEDGKRVFIACTPGDSVAVIDLQTLEITSRLDAGKQPDGMAWASR